MELKNKTILIVAQEDWGDMYISKHHYANELARVENTVYFINGPDQVNKLKLGEIKTSSFGINNLFLVEHRFFYPYIIKFKLPWLHRFLVKIHINNIVKKIKKKIDIVWSFDLSNTMPLRCFPENCIKVFMPVDEPLQDVAIKSAQGADILFSVTNEILKKYNRYSVPKFFINHGVSEKFINDEITQENNNPIRVGLSGNILRPDIDHATLSAIIRSNSNVQFDVWGTINPSLSNLISVRDAQGKSLQFIGLLSELDNVVLHGQVTPSQLANEIKQVDGFLICYDIKKDQSKGTNYHKILEYLATGKVIISNNITTYKNYTGLIEMADSRKSNEELPELFSKVVNNIAYYNSTGLQKKRIEFAKEFTYSKQIQKIDRLINKHLLQKLKDIS